MRVKSEHTDLGGGVAIFTCAFSALVNWISVRYYETNFTWEYRGEFGLFSPPWQFSNFFEHLKQISHVLKESQKGTFNNLLAFKEFEIMNKIIIISYYTTELYCNDVQTIL